MSGGSILNPKANADRFALGKALKKLTPTELAAFQSALERVGSRQPTSDPVWVTLEVLHGGFASGRFVAALKEDEQPSDVYLNDPQCIAELEAMLRSGKYCLDAPENAALLVVVWLSLSERAAEAQKLVEEIAPYMRTLRFYPRHDDTPMPLGKSVALNTVAELRAELLDLKRRTGDVAATRIRYRVLQSNHATLVEPLEERLLTIVMETCDNHQEVFAISSTSGAITSGPWPFQQNVTDPEWIARAKQALRDVAALRLVGAQRTTSGGGCMPTIVRALQKIVNPKLGPSALTGIEVGRVRATLAGVSACRGLPGTTRRSQYVDAVKKAAPASNSGATVDVVLSRLASFGASEALTSLDLVTASVSREEALQHPGALHEGLGIPDGIVSLAKRALLAPLDEHITNGVVSSAEAIAPLVAKLRAATESSGIADDDVAQCLLARSLVAFSKRRSLLLRNLQSQVRAQELPWLQPLLALSRVSSSENQCAQVLRDVTLLWWRHFPETLLPNPLCKQLVGLAQQLSPASRVPLLEELAADIFEHDFGQKFVQAASIAATTLRGSLYERYFGLEAAFEHFTSSAVEGAASQGITRAEFYKIVESTAASFGRTERGNLWIAADSGKVIEAAQVITTHNLAQLYSCITATAPLPLGFDMNATIRQILRAVHKLLKGQETEWHQRLRRKKDLAYAWRHLIFFMSVQLSSGDDGTREELRDCLKTFLKAVDDDRLASAAFKAAVHHEMVNPLIGSIFGSRMSSKPILAWYDWKAPVYP